MSDLIKPIDFKITDPDGKEQVFILSNFPAVEGREIISKYPLTGLPKIGDYEENEKTMLKLMKYVAIRINNQIVRLETKDLVNNHCRDWETLAKIELAMMEKNCSFFQKGRHWDFLENLTQTFLKKAQEMLILSSQQSSPMEKQHSTN